MKNSMETTDKVPAGVKFRRICRVLHRDLSYFFAGVICIYAVSGITLNHKRDFNAAYSIERSEFTMNGDFPESGTSVDREFVTGLIGQLPEKETYSRHAMAGENTLKVFFKGGSSLEVELDDGEAVYEKVRKRPVLYQFNRLHYNPSRWWTWFSDIFAVSLMLITLTGMFMLNGPKGMWGRGGIEFAVGLLFPLLFILLL